VKRDTQTIPHTLSAGEREKRRTVEIQMHQIHKNKHNLLPPADWTAEIQRLQEELVKERDRNLRTLADFKNYRRRIERDGNKIAEESKREILLSILDIIDDMEKALQNKNSAEQPFVKGVQIIYQKLLALLERYGVLPFGSVGITFNHNLHEAVALAKYEGSEPGTVVDELRRGYLWKNELLRAAQVRVAGERTKANKMNGGTR
jgi:molecular chaperone GrpE